MPAEYGVLDLEQRSNYSTANTSLFPKTMPMSGTTGPCDSTVPYALPK